MWGEAIKVAIVGFSAVFVSLLILTASVKIMSLVCMLVQGKDKISRGKETHHASI
jgi:Na+-transporting methylmalonyl-CoA/oxaloacetate decarboxylase gamma subunit